MTAQRRLNRWIIGVTLGFALLTVVILGAVGVASGSTVTTIDADHGLTDRDKIEQFEDQGVASTSLTVPDMSITVAESHEDVGLDGFRLDMDKRYLRVQYNESVPRTVRFYIPSEYWYPILKEDKPAITNESLTATFERTSSGRYTAVTIRFDSQTDAVWAIPKQSSATWWGRDQTRDAVENRTGVDLPSLSVSAQWQYVSDEDLSGNSSVGITSPDGVTLQYDADPAAGSESWQPLPQCGDGDSADVCYYKKSGVGDTVYVLGLSDDPATVRYRKGDDINAKSRGALRELVSIPDRAWSDITDLFGGDDSNGN